jgi:anti-sigma regulatory factor (Ser/Thr protein kinase)
MPRDQSLRLVVPGTVDYLDRIRAFVGDAAGGCGFATETVDEIVLALDEAVANVVEHAYEGSDLPELERTIELIVESNQDGIRFRLRDHGQPFDPGGAAEVDLDTHLASGSQDGLGIHLMRRLMDRISWRPLPSGNELILEKNRLFDREDRLP